MLLLFLSRSVTFQFYFSTILFFVKKKERVMLSVGRVKSLWLIGEFCLFPDWSKNVALAILLIR